MGGAGHCMTVRVFIRSVYGAPLVYVSDHAQAEALHALTGCATLTERHVRALRALGFTVEQEQDPQSVLPATGS